jgi:hypothetical protein
VRPSHSEADALLPGVLRRRAPIRPDWSRFFAYWAVGNHLGAGHGIRVVGALVPANELRGWVANPRHQASPLRSCPRGRTVKTMPMYVRNSAMYVLRNSRVESLVTSPSSRNTSGEYWI